MTDNNTGVDAAGQAGVVRIIIQAGLPLSSLETTLRLERCEALATWVDNKQYEKGLLLFRGGRSINQFRQIWHRLAATLVLIGESVLRVPVQELVRGNPEIMERIDAADRLFIDYFHSIDYSGDAVPLTSAERYRIRCLVTERVEADRSVFPYTDAPGPGLESIEEWYGEGFVQFLTHMVHPIQLPKEYR